MNDYLYRGTSGQFNFVYEKYGIGPLVPLLKTIQLDPSADYSKLELWLQRIAASLSISKSPPQSIVTAIINSGLAESHLSAESHTFFECPILWTIKQKTLSNYVSVTSDISVAIRYALGLDRNLCTRLEHNINTDSELIIIKKTDQDKPFDLSRFNYSSPNKAESEKRIQDDSEYHLSDVRMAHKIIPITHKFTGRSVDPNEFSGLIDEIQSKI